MSHQQNSLSSIAMMVIGLALVASSLVLANQEHQSSSFFGPGCADQQESAAGSGKQAAMRVPLMGMFEKPTRVRRQIAPQSLSQLQPQQQQQQNPLGFLSDLGPQVEQIQSQAKMFSSMVGSAINPKGEQPMGLFRQLPSLPQLQPAGPLSSNLGSQVEPVRVRRQLPSLSQLQPQQQQQQQQNPLGFLSNLGPQVESLQSNAKMFSSLFSSASNPNQAAAASQLQQAFQPQQQQPSAATSAATLMSQLSEMVRAAQDRSAKIAASSQEQIQSGTERALQSGQQQAQQAQGGIQSALVEIGQGLQRIAMNNPSLLPDIKNLYSSISSKLSSASNSATQAAAQQPASAAAAPTSN